MRMFQKEVGVVSNIVSDVSDKMSSVVKKLRLVKVQVLSVLLVALLMVVSASATAETYYFHNDHLGTPQVLTDKDQTVVWKGEYDPFGKMTETVVSVEQNLRFPGQYYDQETELHYNYFRTYDPNTGRYVESDPIGLKGGINTYSYVDGAPVTDIDPFGLAKNKNPKGKYRIIKCRRKELGVCMKQCKDRGGVKSCAVTSGSRATIRNGLTTHELYVVPGSMNCVCNQDDEDSSPWFPPPIILPPIPGPGGGGCRNPLECTPINPINLSMSCS